MSQNRGDDRTLQQADQVAAFRAFVSTLHPVLQKQPVMINYDGKEHRINGFNEAGYFEVIDPGGAGAAARIPVNETTLALVWAQLGLPQIMSRAAGATDAGR